MVTAGTLPLLTTAEYKEIYSYFLDRYHGREKTHECISKCLSQFVVTEQEGLRILMVGPGTGDVELRLFASHKINHLTAVEPSVEMANGLEVNLSSSSNNIKKWNIERTNIESYLTNKSNSEAPFDVILMIHCVYYPSSRVDVLRHLRSLLRPHSGQLIVVVTHGYASKIARKYKPESDNVYDADDLEHDLHNVEIPFERHLNSVTLDITGAKGNDKLQWVFASFFLEVNAASGGANFAAQVVEDLYRVAHTTGDGQLVINLREDVFVVRPID